MKKHYALLTGLGVLAAGLVNAQIVAVDFGADYTSSNINSSQGTGYLATLDADFDGNADDRAYLIDFGTTFTAPNSANWTTPAGKSGAVIKHGLSIANIDSATDPTGTLDRISSADIIQVGSGTLTSAARMATTFYWEKASFLNGLDAAANISFADSATAYSISFSNDGTPTNAGGRLTRAIAQSGGTWYVSETVSGSKSGTLEFNPNATNWYVFDPATGSIFFDTDDLGAAVAGSSLTDITALGVYTQHTLFDGSSKTHAALHGLTGLSVTTVPEPATYALISGLLAIGLIIRRRVS